MGIGKLFADVTIGSAGSQELVSTVIAGVCFHGNYYVGAEPWNPSLIAIAHAGLGPRVRACRWELVCGQAMLRTSPALHFTHRPNHWGTQGALATLEQRLR